MLITTHTVHTAVAQTGTALDELATSDPTTFLAPIPTIVGDQPVTVIIRRGFLVEEMIQEEAEQRGPRSSSLGRTKWRDGDDISTDCSATIPISRHTSVTTRTLPSKLLDDCP